MKKKLALSFVAFAVLCLSCKKDTPWEDQASKGIIIEGASAVITKDTEWKDIFKGDTIDYYVKSPVKIQGNAVLTVKPGVTVSFETPESGIRVEDNAALNADGTLVNPITLTTKSAKAGAWKGVIFASNHVNNKLNYVSVSYAGSAKDDGYCDASTAIGLAKNKKARASITNSSVSFSGGNGLWVAGTFDVTLTFSKNKFSDCIEAPVALTADNMSKLDSLSTYNATSKNYIDVYTVLGSEITSDATIQHLNVPFRISGRIHILKTLTIMPGCIFEFNTGGELTTTDYSGANHTGVIKAEGKSGNFRIFFKGTQAQPGSWVGITITSPGDNLLVNCDISEGGASAGYQNPSATKGNIIVGRIGMGGKATINYCKILNSGGYGIAKYVNSLTPANSSTVNTTKAFFDGGILKKFETNTYATNASGNMGEYH